MTIAFLIILGLGLGSFANALVWRVYQQYKSKKAKKYSITHGRSMCPHCQHSLSVKDLIPVFSWISLRGKCRYCKKSISWQYPAVEVSATVLFVLSYLLWPKELAGWEWLQLAIWLVCLTGFIALIVYDLRYMILPNRIIFPLMAIASFGVAIDSIAKKSTEPISSAVFGLLVGGGIFYLLFVMSDGAWIGGGDVKLGFLLGLLVGGPTNAFLMLFLASLLGTILFLPLLLGNKLSIKKKIPFGPFLIAGGIIVKLAGTAIADLYITSLL